MSTDELIQLFEKHEKEFLQFENIQNKLSNRSDLHAFIVLDKLVPGTCDIVSGAGHDQIWIDVTPDQLAAVATEEQVIDLIRCGLRYNGDEDALVMFA